MQCVIVKYSYYLSPADDYAISFVFFVNFDGILYICGIWKRFIA